MIEDDHYYTMCHRIHAMGYDKKTAAKYAGLIGDRPIVDGDYVIVMDGVQELARLDRKALEIPDRPRWLPGSGANG